MIIPYLDNPMKGSEFCKKHNSSLMIDREEDILNNIISGNIPDFLRDFKKITISENNNTISYFCSPDYLSIGTNEDYIRIPMNAVTAQKVADQYECILPTRKMVNDIWKISDLKLNPMPWGPPYDNTMMSTQRYCAHNQRIQNQIGQKDYTSLISGHKKDVVLTNQLYPNNSKNKVAIYGWIYKSGQAIQQLNAVSHDILYVDYSHGIRLISKDVILNDQPKNILDVLRDPQLNYLLSDEGILNFTSYTNSY